MRRSALALLSLNLLAAAVMVASAQEFPLRAVNIEFGVKDDQARVWDGSVSISPGEIVELRGRHFKESDSLGPGRSWKASTEPWVGYGGGMHPNELPYPHATRVTTVGVTVYYRAPETAEMEVKTAEGDFRFRLSDLPPSGPLHILQTKVALSRVPPAEHISTEAYEDDFPALAAGPEGELSAAWMAYRDEADRVLFRQRRDGAWGETAEVAEEPGDLFGVDVAVDSKGRTWVVWARRNGQSWRLQARSLDDGRWGAVETLATGGGNNLFHRLAAGPDGALHLVYQSARRDRSDISYLRYDGQTWSAEASLSDPEKDPHANDWFPDVAVDSRGTAWAVWDTYDGGSYNVRMRSIRDGRPGQLLRVTDTPRYHGHPTVAVDGQDRVWVSYDEAEENWAKDTGFLLTGGAGIYQSRTNRIAIWDGAEWLAPRDDLNLAVPPSVRRFAQSPKLVWDAAARRMWALLRPRTSATRPETLWAAGGKWEVMATYYSGDRWAPVVWLPESVGRNEGPFDAIAAPDGAIYAAWVTDQKLYGGPTFGHYPRDNQVVVGELAAQFEEVEAPPAELGRRGSEPPTRLPSEPREAEQISALRDYRIKSGDNSYGIYRGDLHRHTEISLDGSGDGSLFDAFRYMIDAAGMDYFLVTDHKGGGSDTEYNWWRTEKAEDMFYTPDRFVTLFGYERSLSYPNGHRNIIYADRGHKPILITQEERDTSTGRFLYEPLRESGGIATSHTSHTSMGTDWRDNDPELEPIVEIFQGARTSAEHEGAPLAPSGDRTDLWAGNYRPKGFVWNAWEKGYKLGVQASSDHVSTHTSYAMVVTDDFSREGLVDAMRRRHTYAATSNIILDFRLRDGEAEYIHGDEFSADSIPEIAVKVQGTAPLKQLDLIRDNQYVHAQHGSGETLEFSFREQSLEPGEHYYYVRVEQQDGNVAWSSPIWVRYQPGE